MPRIKVIITDVYNAKDHAMGFDSPRLVEAAEKAIAWLVQQTGAVIPTPRGPAEPTVEPADATFTPVPAAVEVKMTTRAFEEAIEDQAALAASTFGKALEKENEGLLADVKKAAMVERMAKARAAR